MTKIVYIYTMYIIYIYYILFKKRYTLPITDTEIRRRHPVYHRGSVLYIKIIM